MTEGWHAVPKVLHVVAGSGRSRWLLVYWCGDCSERHVAHARILRDTLRRKTACGRSFVVLHTDAQQSAA